MSRNGDHPGEGAPRRDALDLVEDPEDYAVLRKVRQIKEAEETVIRRREVAYEMFWERRIDRSDYLKAIRMAVERYLLLSEQTIKSHKHGQWFWSGEPPTQDGRSPYEWGEDGDAELIAIRPDQILTDDDGEVIPMEDLKNPVLVVDDEGSPPFGTAPNVLGTLNPPEVEDEIAFIGLADIRHAPDPFTFEYSEVGDHPLQLRTMDTKTVEYQIPEDVLMEAYSLLNQFWTAAGLGFDHDRGLPVQKGINFTEGEKGHVERGDRY